jgi:hypothetical protein
MIIYPKHLGVSWHQSDYTKEQKVSWWMQKLSLHIVLVSWKDKIQTHEKISNNKYGPDKGSLEEDADLPR